MSDQQPQPVKTADTKLPEGKVKTILRRGGKDVVKK